MNILIDLGHPAHIQYFHNFILIMKKRGHNFKLIARDKEVLHRLLEAYDFSFSSRGKGKKSIIGKQLYLCYADCLIYKYAKKFNPDLFISFASPYAAHVSKLLGRPHIAFDDTEHAKYSQMLYVPFTDCIITPKSFKNNYGTKQIRFDGTMDLAYLHPDYFHPKWAIYQKYDRKSGMPNVLLRFVSWNASHDKGYKGLSFDDKLYLINKIKDRACIYISSEEELPSELRIFKLEAQPEEIYDFLHYCTLFIGESGSMATEAAVLGTHSIICNSASKHFGVFDHLCEYGSLFRIDNVNEIVLKAEELLADPSSKSKALKIAHKIIEDSTNLTPFMVWFVENYPTSFRKMQSGENYEYFFDRNFLSKS